MLKWFKKREIREIEALQKKVNDLETEIYCLKALPAFLFDDPDLLWKAIWRDVDEQQVIGYAISSSLAVKLLKTAGFST